MEVKSFLNGIVSGTTTTYIEKYGRQGLERRWHAKESLKAFLIDTLWLSKEEGTFIGHLLEAVACVLSLVVTNILCN